MPITFAHPAAVVPLARRGLVLSALVIGSVTPDFTYFLLTSSDRAMDHSLSAVLRFGLPAGLVALWLYQVVLKRPLLSLLPASHQERLAPLAAEFQFGPLRRFFMVAVSIVIGALTHLAWDSFTHLTGWGVRHLPLLRTAGVDVAGAYFPAYKLLQYSSGVVGVAILIVWYLLLVKDAPGPLATSPQWPRLTKALVASTIVISAGIVGLAYGLRFLPSITGLGALKELVGWAVRTVVWIALAEIAAYSVVWHVRNTNVVRRKE